MELADTPCRKLERAALGRRKRAARRFHLRGPHAQPRGREFDAIEARAEFDQRAVAAPAHGGDYFRHRRVDRGAVGAAALEHRVEKAAKRGAMRVQDRELHLCLGRFLIDHPLDRRAERPQLRVERLVAAVQMIHAAKLGAVLGGEAGQDKPHARAQIGRHHRRAA